MFKLYVQNVMKFELLLKLVESRRFITQRQHETSPILSYSGMGIPSLKRAEFIRFQTNRNHNNR